MTLVIDMAPETERRLRDEAARKGLEPERYARHMLEEQLHRERQADAPSLPRAESELLQHINEGLPVETWRQYHALIAMRDAGTLTADDRKTLVGLIDKVEIAHARRMEYLVELANLRGTTPGRTDGRARHRQTHLCLTGSRRRASGGRYSSGRTDAANIAGVLPTTRRIILQSSISIRVCEVVQTTQKI